MKKKNSITRRESSRTILRANHQSQVRVFTSYYASGKTVPTLKSQTYTNPIE